MSSLTSNTYQLSPQVEAHDSHLCKDRICHKCQYLESMIHKIENQSPLEPIYSQQ
jgi:hypothetical protein